MLLIQLHGHRFPVRRLVVSAAAAGLRDDLAELAGRHGLPLADSPAAAEDGDLWLGGTPPRLGPGVSPDAVEWAHALETPLVLSQLRHARTAPAARVDAPLFLNAR